MVFFHKRIYFLVIIAAIFLCSCHKDKVTNIDKETNLNIVFTFSIPADKVVLNPTGYSPLAALVTFTSSSSGHTEIIVKGKHGTASDVKQIFTDNGTSHSIPVLGLYANYKNTIEVYVVGSNNTAAKSTITITTGGLPVNVPSYINTDTVNMAGMEPGFNLVSSLSGYPTPPCAPYITDSFGDIRWILDYTNSPILKTLFYDCGIARLQNGNYFFGNVNSGAIYEVDVFGKIINTWSLGNYIFHHNVTEKPNGNFLVTVTNPASTNTRGVHTVEDYVIEIDRTTGSIINTWDLKQSLNAYRRVLIADSVDWFHGNGVIYDPSDNTIILSGRVQGVVKLTADNQVKWILGPHLDWGTNGKGENLNQYLLTPLDSKGNAITDTLVTEGYTNSTDFEWNWYQHSPILLPNGDLMVFDNGATRNYNDNVSHHYSRAVEFKIDPVNMTVQQIWEYGKERYESTFSLIISSVQYLPQTNHILFSPGYNVPNTNGAGGKIVEVDYATKKVVFQQSINSPNLFAWHRAKRFPLYPNGNPYVQ